MLLKQIQNKNITISASLEMYINSFRHGTYPHGGAGIGLDRLVFLYLGNINNTVKFTCILLIVNCKYI
jgi:aspartyl-tRNA synthetase